MPQCAGSVAKKRSAKPKHFLCVGWSSDTISRRGQACMMSCLQINLLIGWLVLTFCECTLVVPWSEKLALNGNGEAVLGLIC